MTEEEAVFLTLANMAGLPAEKYDNYEIVMVIGGSYVLRKKEDGGDNG